MSAQTAPEGNPFQYHSPIRDPDAFVGREWELQFAFEVIDKGEFVSIVGARKSGKSSLLQMIKNEQVQDRCLLTADELLFVYLDLEEDTFGRPDDFLSTVLGRTVKQSDIQDDLSPAMDRWSELEECLRALSPRRLVLLLDHFEQISADPNFGTDFYDALRALVVRHDVSILVTTRKYLYLCLPDQSPEVSPFFNIFRVLTLGPFSASEYEAFIADGAQRSGMPLQNWQEEIRDLGGHFPFFVAMAGAHFFESWSEKGQITSEDIATVREQFILEATPHFEAIWNDLSEGERKALWELVNGRSPADAPHLGLLEDRGYVLDGRPFSSPFGEYVLQQGAS